jgi:hypothetical protein
MNASVVKNATQDATILKAPKPELEGGLLGLLGSEFGLGSF